MKRYFAALLLTSLIISLVGCSMPPAQTTPTSVAITTTPAETTETTTAKPTEPTLSEEELQILAERRQAVIDEMTHMMTFLWRPDTDITYSKQWSSEGLDKDEWKNIFTFKAGRLYSGLPYTHGSGSAFDFQAYATERDENGIYHISGMNTAVLSGIDTMEENLRSRVGSDCNDAVYWAWSKISPSIDFMYTYEMNEAHGCVKVGEYESDPERHSMTKEICQKNGTDVMFAAYAQLQPGDTVVHNNSPSSHAMLISDVVIKYKPDGSPDYMKSYVTVIHQTSGNLFEEKYYYNEKLGENVYYCGGVNDVYEFWKLFGNGYLPFTCKELVDPAPIDPEWVKDSESNHSIENITTGIISSNFPVSNVTLTIKDANNNDLMKATCFVIGDELKDFNMYHFTEEIEKDVMVGSYDMASLAAGTYRCVLTCQLSTGNHFTVRDFTFTK